MKKEKFGPLNPLYYSSNGTIDSVYYSDGRKLTYKEKIRLWYCWDFRSNFWNDYSIEHLKNKSVQVFIEELQNITCVPSIPEWKKIAVGTTFKKVKLITNHLGEIMTTAERVVPRYLDADRIMRLRQIDFNLIDELLKQIGTERYWDNGKVFFRKGVEEAKAI